VRSDGEVPSTDRWVTRVKSCPGEPAVRPFLESARDLECAEHTAGVPLYNVTSNQMVARVCGDNQLALGVSSEDQTSTPKLIRKAKQSFHTLPEQVAHAVPMPYEATFVWQPDSAPESALTPDGAVMRSGKEGGDASESEHSPGAGAAPPEDQLRLDD
jgi:hypothetical protein